MNSRPSIVLAHSMIRRVRAVVAFSLLTTLIPAQTPQEPASSLTSRSIMAIGYQVGGGSTKVDLQNTGLIAQVDGQAEGRSQTRGNDGRNRDSGFDVSDPFGCGVSHLRVVGSVAGRPGVNLGEVLFDKTG